MFAADRPGGLPGRGLGVALVKAHLAAIGKGWRTAAGLIQPRDLIACQAPTDRDEIGQKLRLTLLRRLDPRAWPRGADTVRPDAVRTIALWDSGDRTALRRRLDAGSRPHGPHHGGSEVGQRVGQRADAVVLHSAPDPQTEDKQPHHALSPHRHATQSRSWIRASAVALLKT